MPEASPHLLLCGFEPFGGLAHNPSLDVVSEVAGRAEVGQLVTQQEHDDVVISSRALPAAQQRIIAAEIPVSLSLSAGTYVCNEVLYTLLHHISVRGLPVSAGFIHVPDLRSSDSPLSLAQAADAVDLVITESLKGSDDLLSSTGTLH